MKSPLKKTPGPDLRGKKLLAIDYGRVRIGLATGDPMGISLTLIGFIRRENDAQAATVVAQVVKEHGCEGILLGLPLHANGDRGANVEWVMGFRRELAKVCALPVAEVDERYSSAEADDLLRERGEWPAKPGRSDAAAAAILLRRYQAGEV
jgi:putative Holliday junction resolvase